MTFIFSERRGRPVIFFASLLLCWIALRIATFETPWPRAANLGELVGVEQASATRAVDVALPRGQRRQVESVKAYGPQLEPLPLLPGAERFPTPAMEIASPATSVVYFARGRRAAGHNFAWMAAMASLPMPASVAAIANRQPDPASPRTAPGLATIPPTDSRWRVDGWLLLRSGGARIAQGGTRPASYGASQIGAILAFRLAPNAARQPSVYLRTSHALVAQGESEAALGVSLRPLPSLPFIAHAELRATRRPGAIELRPSAFLSAGFARENLPFGLASRGYAQGGFVAGDFATGFADGQLVIDREMENFDLGTVRAGAGVWGGAQRDASRLDIGPTVNFELEIAETPLRLAVDYRLRVAGEAEPVSGMALTLSTGF